MKKKIAVFRGGRDATSSLSLKTGALVLRALEESDFFEPLDIFIDEEGVWHRRGVPVLPEQVCGSVDVVYNTLHDPYGEGGELQKILDAFSVPYTGSGSYVSALAFNKELTKKKIAEMGIRTPRSVTLSVTDDLEERVLHIFRTFPQPSVVKPLFAGSSLGVGYADSFSSFKDAIKNAFQFSSKVMIEEFVRGREAVVGIIDRFRGRHSYHLPVVEIRKDRLKKPIFSFDDRCSEECYAECPGSFTSSEKEKLKEAALLVHSSLSLRDYSVSDFIVSKNDIYFIESNTLSPLTTHSPFLVALNSVGVTPSEFVGHLIDLAVSRR